jgi:Ser/Thr protein kinase RdoA (MazF antagonist)
VATFTVLDLADAQVVARRQAAAGHRDRADRRGHDQLQLRRAVRRRALVRAGQRGQARTTWPGRPSWSRRWRRAAVPLAIDGARYLRHRGLLISVFHGSRRSPRRGGHGRGRRAAALGQTLGAIHRVARPRWPPTAGPASPVARRRRPPERDRRRSYFAKRSTPSGVAAVAEVAAAAPARAAASHGIIHGDLFRDNVLWQADRVVAVLDFEQASSGSLPYDVAVAINDWCWPGERDLELDGARAHALAAAHRAASPWTAADRAALGPELLAAAIRFTITRLTDVYLRQVDNPDKDYRAFLARVRFWRSPEGAAMSTALAHR